MAQVAEASNPNFEGLLGAQKRVPVRRTVHRQSEAHHISNFAHADVLLV